VLHLPASSRKLRQRKGKHAVGDNGNSDSSSINSSSNDGEDIRPTPVKKPSGIERLHRGRKIKASSPAGRNNPTRTCFELLFDLLFDLLFIYYFIYYLIYCLIYFLTSTGSSSVNSPASDAGFIYPDDETNKKISLHLYARVIHAINDIVPYHEGNAPKPEPFLYWEDPLDATTALIKRYVIVIVTCVLFFTLLCKNVIPHDTKNIPLDKCGCAAYVVCSYLATFNFI
jgi:hypothetical protein